MNALLERIAGVAARRHWIFIISWVIILGAFVMIDRIMRRCEYATQTSSRAATPLASGGFAPPVCGTPKSATMLPKADCGHPTYAATKRIRPFTPDDIPEVVDLHKRVFPGNSFSPGELEVHFRRLFFENPWYDADLPSLVYQEQGDKICGFYGVIPRRMRMKGRPIRAAVSSQFMVDPSVRNRLAAVELQSAFFAGPQDLSFTDGANEASRKIWEGLGGLTAFPYSVHWTRLLRPTRYFLGSAGSPHSPNGLCGRPPLSLTFWPLTGVEARFTRPSTLLRRI